jgi:hypothetical protein
MKIKPILLTVSVCLTFAPFLFGQTEPKFDFYNRGEYRANVPKPQSILRFDVGDHHTTYAQMEQVIEAIAKTAPDRVKDLRHRRDERAPDAAPGGDLGTGKYCGG